MSDPVEIEPPIIEQKAPDLKTGPLPPQEGWDVDENGFYDPTMVDPNDIDPAKR